MNADQEYREAIKHPEDAQRALGSTPRTDLAARGGLWGLSRAPVRPFAF